MSHLALAQAAMVDAATLVTEAMEALQEARIHYTAATEIPRPVRVARIAALTAKVDALAAVRPDPSAHPWASDFKELET